MPSSRLLKAAITASDPGGCVVTTGFLAVVVGVLAAVAGFLVSVDCFGFSAAWLVLVDRGRAVVAADEFVFCPNAIIEAVKKRDTRKMNVLIMILLLTCNKSSPADAGALRQKRYRFSSLNITKFIQGIETGHTAAQAIHGTLAAQDLEDFEHRGANSLSG